MRPTKDEYFMRMATLVASRATCLRRSVGCVLTSERSHVLSTGYNGVCAGQPHCNEQVPVGDMTEAFWFPNACDGGHDSPSGVNLDACQAIHAEQNALLQCRDVFQIQNCYCTTLPCVTCTKLLLNTSCQRIVFIEEYPHFPQVYDLWTKAGRLLVKGRL